MNNQFLTRAFFAFALLAMTTGGAFAQEDNGEVTGHPLPAWTPVPKPAVTTTTTVTTQTTVPAAPALPQPAPVPAPPPKPVTVPVAIQRATVDIQQGKLEEAVQLVQGIEGVGGYKYLGALYNKIGDADFKGKQFPAAVSWYQRTVRFSPDPNLAAYAHLMLARCDVSLNSHAQAHRELTLVIADPHVAEHYKTRAAALLKTLPKSR